MRFLMVILLLAGCSSVDFSGGTVPQEQIHTDTAPQRLTNQQVFLAKASFDALPGWHADDHKAALASFRRSCTALLVRPSSARSKAAIPGLERKADWHPVCREALRIEDKDAKAFFEEHFAPYRVAAEGSEKPTDKPNGKFTGYYQISLKAARKKSAVYQYPIYAVPSDLKQRKGAKGEPEWGRLVAGKWQPYHARAEIERGALGNKAKVLFWAKDPVDVFLLHIQGSGQIELPDGTRAAVGFGGRNGHPYGSIGTVLIKNGALKPAETNIGTIRAWLARNPQKRQEILNTNASYIFFKEQNHLDPIGAMGVALTPRRSLAVDPSFIPYGAPLWVDIPGNDRLPGGLQSLLIAQDTGAAIKGAVRGDVFWGHDAVAEERAGTMNNPGSYYLLLPRQQLVANAL